MGTGYWSWKKSASGLIKYLDKDKLGMLRRMETHEEDRIRIDIQSMWKEKIPCGRITEDDAIPDGRRAQGAEGSWW